MDANLWLWEPLESGLFFPAPRMSGHIFFSPAVEYPQFSEKDLKGSTYGELWEAYPSGPVKTTYNGTLRVKEALQKQPVSDISVLCGTHSVSASERVLSLSLANYASLSTLQIQQNHTLMKQSTIKALDVGRISPSNSETFPHNNSYLAGINDIIFT